MNKIENRKMKNIKCFYHRADLDGHCSAAIINYYAKKNNLLIENIGYDYGDDTSIFLNFDKDSVIYMADLTPPIDIFERMINFYQEVHWIDHHKSAIEEVSKQKFSKNIKGLQKIGKGACELVYEYLFKKEAPYAVKLLSMYDVFNNDNKDLWNSIILPFQYGCRSQQGRLLEDDNIYWDILLNDEIGKVRSEIIDLLEIGEICLDFEKSQYSQIAPQLVYRTKFEGLNAVVINHSSPGSAIFDSVKTEEDEIMILWRFKQNHWSVSLYGFDNSDIDCSEIAKKYGGGGHKSAAGFRLEKEENPLKLFGIIE